MEIKSKYRVLKRFLRRNWFLLKKNSEKSFSKLKKWCEEKFPELGERFSKAREGITNYPYKVFFMKYGRKGLYKVMTGLRRIKWRFDKLGKDYQFRRQLDFLPQHILIEEAKNPVLVRLFTFIICFFFFSFFVWAGFSQLNEVAKTQGEIIPDGYIQKVQHLEGGIVQDILIREGDYVEKGDILAILTDPEAIAEFERLFKKVKNLNYEAERLQYIIKNKPLPFYLLQQNQDPLYQSNLALLEVTRRSFKDQERVLERQIDQKRSQTAVFRSKLQTIDENLKISKEIFSIKQALFAQGYATKPSLLDAEVEVNNLEGEKREIQKELSKSLIVIDEFQTRIDSLRSEFENKAWEQYVFVMNEIQENGEIKEKLRKQIEGFVLRAPSSGFIYGLSVNTIGGVVKPGEIISQVVPMNKDLFAEVKIQPKDIAHVKIGQEVAIKVTSFDFSRYGTLKGKVVSTSAASFKTEEGYSYYKGIVQMEKNYFGDNPIKNIVIPGMELEADIITGQKSVLSYLMKPIYLSINSALNER